MAAWDLCAIRPRLSILPVLIELNKLFGTAAYAGFPSVERPFRFLRHAGEENCIVGIASELEYMAGSMVEYTVSAGFVKYFDFKPTLRGLWRACKSDATNNAYKLTEYRRYCISASILGGKVYS